MKSYFLIIFLFLSTSLMAIEVIREEDIATKQVVVGFRWTDDSVIFLAKVAGDEVSWGGVDDQMLVRLKSLNIECLWGNVKFEKGIHISRLYFLNTNQFLVSYCGSQRILELNGVVPVIRQIDEGDLRMLGIPDDSVPLGCVDGWAYYYLKTSLDSDIYAVNRKFGNPMHWHLKDLGFHPEGVALSGGAKLTFRVFGQFRSKHFINYAPFEFAVHEVPFSDGTAYSSPGK